MIYEEDIETAHNTAIGVLGKNGRMLERGKTVVMDVKVKLTDGSIIWYGDLDLPVDLPKVKELATKLDCALIACTQNGKVL